MTPSPGRKRRFLGYGALNVLITNLVLQGLLPLMTTGLATLISQLLNVSLGFVLYGTRVFRVERLHKRAALAYGVLALLLWWANWAGITALAALECSAIWVPLHLFPCWQRSPTRPRSWSCSVRGVGLLCWTSALHRC